MFRNGYGLRWILMVLVILAIFDLGLFFSTRREARGESATVTPTASPVARPATSPSPSAALTASPTMAKATPTQVKPTPTQANATPTRAIATPTMSPDDLLFSADRQTVLPATYVPPDLVTLTTVRSTTPNQKIRRVALPYLEQLVAAAKTAGFELAVSSAYRSYSEQETTYAYWVSTLGKAQADRVSAQPGHSEHQLGLALDLTSASVGFALTDDFGAKPEGKWLRENAYRYGFIIRYPEGKEDVTGYAYEPWHIRYVGAGPAATMYQKDLTLDEYLRSGR